MDVELSKFGVIREKNHLAEVIGKNDARLVSFIQSLLA